MVQDTELLIYSRARSNSLCLKNMDLCHTHGGLPIGTELADACGCSPAETLVQKLSFFSHISSRKGQMASTASAGVRSSLSERWSLQNVMRRPFQCTSFLRRLECLRGRSSTAAKQLPRATNGKDLNASVSGIDSGVAHLPWKYERLRWVLITQQGGFLTDVM